MMESYGMSDIGLVRAHNEDSFVIDKEHGFFAVADGMGGAQAGEIASQIAIDTLVAEVRRDGEDASLDTLTRGVELANKNIRAEARKNPAYDGMGTTIVAALSRPPKLAIASVGDSRGYLRRDGQLSCVTSDDSWINDVGRRLGLPEEQLRVHPYRHVLTRAAGADEEIIVETQEIDFSEGDMLLISSDGLHNVASEEEMLEVLSRGGPLPACCRALIDLARANGAPDNITALLLRSVPESDSG